MENKFIKESAAELLEKLGKRGAEKEKEILSVVNKLVQDGFPFLSWILY